MNQIAQILNFPNPTGGSTPLQGPLPASRSASTIGDLFTLGGNNLLDIVVFLAGGILLIYIIIGGYKYLTAQGDPKAIDGARNTITYALIGFGIVAFSYLIFQVAELFFGFKILGQLPQIVSPAYAAASPQVDLGTELKLGNDPVTKYFGSFGALFGRILDFAIPIAGIVFLIFLVFGGIKWASSQGDKAAVQSARGTLTTAIIGLVIVISSYLVLQVINLLTGFNVGTGN